MPYPRFEVPSGVIDGVNQVFTVSVPYQPGTTAVYLNGLLQERSLDDGWDETNPAAGEVTLKEAPLDAGLCPDVIQIFFIDTSPVLPETVIEYLRGTLVEAEELSGSLRSDTSLRVTLEEVAELSGTARPVVELGVTLEAVEALQGRLLMVCR